jgi:dolichyl-phosphate-mannose-protein mannosyltransferase
MRVVKRARGRDRRDIAFAIAAVLVTLYAGLLRYEALVANYGWMGQPAWSVTLATYAVPVAHALRPASIVWGPNPKPYVNGDPINYLRYAREMRHFYQAHVREPVFLALTRACLWLTGGRDIGLSFASAIGGTLAVLATCLLGAAAASRLVGLAAGFALAIEMTAVVWSIDGWRDDTFMLFVTLTAWAFVRLHLAPSNARGAVAGVIAALASLTRLSALSFIVPGLVWFVATGPREDRRQRIRSAAVAASVATVLVAPYLINCWREHGDPFYAINYHTGYYRAAEGLPHDRAESALEYLTNKLTVRPVRTLDTALQGLVTFPIANKFHGFIDWSLYLGPALRWCAIAGMIAALWSSTGRLLLVILITALLPYAVTWSVGGGSEWRFTQHVYPIYLVFAFAAIAQAIRIGQVVLRERRVARPSRPQMARAAAAVGAGVLAVIGYMYLPMLVMRESLAAGEAVDVHAGERDSCFFTGEWSTPIGGGNVIVRVAEDPLVSVRLPLPPASYWMTLRMDPAETQDELREPRVTVFLNRKALGEIDLTRDPQRIGSYRMLVPASAVKPLSRLDLLATHTVRAADAGRHFSSLKPDTPVAFRLWYVRLDPIRGGATE